MEERPSVALKLSNGVSMDKAIKPGPSFQLMHLSKFNQANSHNNQLNNKDNLLNNKDKPRKSLPNSLQSPTQTTGSYQSLTRTKPSLSLLIKTSSLLATTREMQPKSSRSSKMETR